MSARSDSPDLFDFALSPLPPFPEDELDDPKEINVHNVGFFTRQAKALEECRMEEAIRVRRVSILDLDAPMKLRTDLPLFRDLILSVSERETDPALTPWLSSPIKPTFHNASDGLGYKKPPFNLNFNPRAARFSPSVSYIARNPISISPEESESLLYENSSFSNIPLPTDSDSIMPSSLSFKDFMSQSYSDISTPLPSKIPAGPSKISRARQAYREPYYRKPFYKVLEDLPAMPNMNPRTVPPLISINPHHLIRTPLICAACGGDHYLRACPELPSKRDSYRTPRGDDICYNDGCERLHLHYVHQH